MSTQPSDKAYTSVSVRTDALDLLVSGIDPWENEKQQFRRVEDLSLEDLLKDVFELKRRWSLPLFDLLYLFNDLALFAGYLEPWRDQGILYGPIRRRIGKIQLELEEVRKNYYRDRFYAVRDILVSTIHEYVDHATSKPQGALASDYFAHSGRATQKVAAYIAARVDLVDINSDIGEFVERAAEDAMVRVEVSKKTSAFREAEKMIGDIVDHFGSVGERGDDPYAMLELNEHIHGYLGDWRNVISTRLERGLGREDAAIYLANVVEEIRESISSERRITHDRRVESLEDCAAELEEISYSWLKSA